MSLARNPLSTETLRRLGPLCEKVSDCTVSQFDLGRKTLISSSCATVSMSPGQFRPHWSANVQGLTSPASETNESDFVSVELKLSRRLERDDNCVYALVFDYFLTPVLFGEKLSIDSTPSGAISLANVDENSINSPVLLTQPSKNLASRDGRAMGMQLFKVKNAQIVDRIKLKVDISVTTDFPSTECEFDIILSNFSIYKLYNYSTSLYFKKINSSGIELIDYLTQESMEIFNFEKINSGVKFAVVELKRLSNPTIFLKISGKTIRYNLERRTLSIVFPLPETASLAENNDFDWRIIEYIARLEFYGLELKLLYLDDELNLDILLDRGGLANAKELSPSPMTSPVSHVGPKQFDVMHFYHQLTSNVRSSLGGDSAAKIDALLKFSAKQGQNFIISELEGLSDASSFEPLRRAGIKKVGTTYHWNDNYIVSGVSSLREPLSAVGAIEPSNHLFINPVHQDNEVAAIAAEKFAADLKAFAESGLRKNAELAISLLEMGDTSSPMPFVLPTGGADGALTADMLDQIVNGSGAIPQRTFYLPQHWVPHLADESSFQFRQSIPGFPLKANYQYQIGYWQHLSWETDKRIDFLKPMSAPGFQAEIRGIEYLLSDVMQSTSNLTGMFCQSPSAIIPGNASAVWEQFKLNKPDFSKFNSVRPSNGPYDLTMYDSHEISNRAISERRRLALEGLGPELRMQWYCGFRHWLKTNLNYLAAACNNARQVVRDTKNFVWSNVSKPHGYGGFECYNLARSGILDVAVFHDERAREYTMFSHLVFSGVFADFARAFSRVPRETYNPFSSRQAGFGTYFGKDRPDIKTIIWASRGARLFQTWSTADHILFSTDDNGFSNSGDLSYLMHTQTRSVMDTLDLTGDCIVDASRVPAKIAMVIPQTDIIWTMADQPASTPKTNWIGYEARYSIDGAEFVGVHALFTHLQLPVDLVFEEAIADGYALPAQELSKYDVLWLNMRFVRDDVLFSIAHWVERGGVLLLGQPEDISHLLNVPQQFVDAPAIAFNEFADNRRAPSPEASREQWLSSGMLVSDAAIPDGATVRKHGNGVIVDFGNRNANENNNRGYDYINKLLFGISKDIPSMVPCGNAETTQPIRDQFEEFLTFALKETGKLTDNKIQRSVTVKSVNPNEPCLVEVIDTRYQKQMPQQIAVKSYNGAIFIINHQHRQFDASKINASGGKRNGETIAVGANAGDIANLVDPRTGEHFRKKQKVRVTIHDLEDRDYGVMVQPSDTLISRQFKKGIDGFSSIEIELEDYAVIGWK